MARFIKAEKSEQADKYRLTADNGKVYGFTASILDDHLNNPMLVVMTDMPEAYIASSTAPGGVLDPSITDWVDVTPTPKEITAFLKANSCMRTAATDNDN